MKVFINIILISIVITNTINAQTAKQRRDWVVGHYVGFWKDSTNHTPWTAGTWDIYYSTSTLSHDSMVRVPDGTEFYVELDSSLWMFYSGPSLNDGGKLYYDSTLLYHTFSPGSLGGGGGAVSAYFKGKMTQSYVGINELKIKNEELKVFPIPANNKVNIEAKEITEVKFHDMLGKEILSTKGKEIDVSNLSEGIYFVQIKTSEGVLTKKIVVQR